MKAGVSLGCGGGFVLVDVWCGVGYGESGWDGGYHCDEVGVLYFGWKLLTIRIESVDAVYFANRELCCELCIEVSSVSLLRAESFRGRYCLYKP